MIRKLSFALAGIAALGLCTSLVAWAAKPPPKTVTLKACQKAKSPVEFPHEKHVKDYKVECKSCHHAKAEAQGCAGCHQGKAEGKKPGCQEMSMTKNPYHITCINCHKSKGKGPKSCKECHK